jgi:hypothetical protein
MCQRIMTMSSSESSSPRNIANHTHSNTSHPCRQQHHCENLRSRVNGVCVFLSVLQKQEYLEYGGYSNAYAGHQVAAAAASQYASYYAQSYSPYAVSGSAGSSSAGAGATASGYSLGSGVQHNAVLPGNSFRMQHMQHENTAT